MEPCIIVHGGSRTIPNELKDPYRVAVQLAAKKGYEVLLKGGSAVDAVEAAVRIMEDNPLLNAGHGCALTEDNTVELDALIMDGHKLAAGAVGCVQSIANPVSLARHVMEDTPHCLLVGDGALKFAKKIGFPILENPLDLITAESHERSRNVNTYLKAIPQYVGTVEPKEDKTANRVGDATKGGQGFDTVGAVAMDSCGRLASATSTGGLPKKMLGRVGDSPLVGCGGYANTVGAATTTGHGEALMKTVLAWDVVRNMEDGLNSKQACEKSVTRMVASVQGVGGVIALNSHGEFGWAFSSQHMVWVSVSGNVMKCGLECGEELEVPL